MTVPPPNGSALPPQASAPPAPTRVVVVVPRREPGVHEYLQRALARVKDVEVVLDRRTVEVPPVDDRRRRPAKNSERKLLICSLVHCPIEPPPSPGAPPPMSAPRDGEPRRTLLWPDLRLQDL